MRYAQFSVINFVGVGDTNFDRDVVLLLSEGGQENGTGNYNRGCKIRKQHH